MTVLPRAAAAPAADFSGPRGWPMLLAVLLINLPTGSLYAFSVFIPAYEQALSVARTELSAMFTVAALGYTTGMLLAPISYRWGRPGALLMGFGVVLAAGWSLAANAPNLVVLGIAYGVLFGFAGGMAYSVIAQVVNLGLPAHRRGFGNGFLVASFSAGTVLLAPVCAWGLERIGLTGTLYGMAALTIVGAAGAALLVRASGITLAGAASLAGRGPADGQPGWVFALLWIGFAFAASAGLMCLSQARVIVGSYGGALTQSVLGTASLAAGATAGRLIGGFLLDYFPAKRVILGAHALGALSLCTLLVLPGPGVAVGSMSVACFGYGLLSGAYAAAMVRYYGAAMFGRMTGRLYTAWGVAATVGPLIAGQVFDRTGGYVAAIGLGALAMGLGFACSLALPHTPAPQRA